MLLLRGLPLEYLRSVSGCGLLLRLWGLEGSDVECIQLLSKAVLLSLFICHRLCDQIIDGFAGRSGS